MKRKRKRARCGQWPDKIQYSKAGAKRAARYKKRIGGWKHINAYPCPFCHAWHLGTAPTAWEG